MKKNTNHGLLYRRKSTDFVAGTVTGLPYEVRRESGDWTPEANQIIKEKQWFPKFDTMACVSFSADNVCEIQILAQTGVQVNLSDRFLAKMSGTTMAGNYLTIVGDTLRKIGNVLEEEWPKPPEDTATWDSYYSDIPQFIIDRAKAQFLDKYTVQTEWVGNTPDAIRYHLKHAPLQFVIPGHAICGIMLSMDGNKFTYLDTYDPYIKTLPITSLTDVYKILLTVKGNKTMLVNDNGTTFLVGPKGKLGVADPKSQELLLQMFDIQSGSTAGLPQIGTLTHDDAFIIHK